MRSFLLSSYCIGFGLVTILAELKVQFKMKRISHIFHNEGKGFWVFFLATLAVGGEWWPIIIAMNSFMVSLCISNIVARLQNEGSESGDSRWGISSVDSNESGDVWHNPAADIKKDIDPTVELAKNKAMKTEEVIPAVANLYEGY